MTIRRGEVNLDHTALTADGAERLLNATTRRADSAAAGKVALESVEHGIPATLESTRGRVHTQSGWSNGYYGGYGSGWMDPGLVASERATFGQSWYRAPLPVLAPSGVRMSGDSFVSEAAPVPCPRRRLAVTLQERVACNRQDLDAVGDSVYGR